MMFEGKVQSRQLGSDSWGTMRIITADDSLSLQKQLDDCFAGWNRASLDMLGPFYGWQFKIVQSV